jgi:type IV fimbrial biogenesis protein FimT
MSQRGFTLWELLVTVLLIGIVLSLGIPNFSDFTRNSEMAAAVNALVSSLHASRTEAVKRGIPVTLCSSTAPLAAAPVCDGGTGGFFAFTDTQNTDADLELEGNGVFDGADEILLRRDRPADGITVATQGAGLVRFSPNGFIDTTTPGMERVMYCDQRGNVTGPGGDSVARIVVISPTGRPQLLRDSASIADFMADNAASCP